MQIELPEEFNLEEFNTVIASAPLPSAINLLYPDQLVKQKTRGLFLLFKRELWN